MEGGQGDVAVGGRPESAACICANLSAGECCSVDVQNRSIQGEGAAVERCECDVMC